SAPPFSHFFTIHSCPSRQYMAGHEAFSGCIVIRPDHNVAYLSRAQCHQELSQLDDAEAGNFPAIAAATDEQDRITAYNFRHRLYQALRLTGKALQGQARIIELSG